MKTLKLLFVLTIISIASQAQQPCLKLTGIEMEKPLYTSGSTVFTMKLEAEANNTQPRNKDCYVLIESQLLGKQMPTFDVDQPPEGITARIKAVKAKAIDQNDAVGSVKAREISITVSLAAAASAPTGDFTLSGTLHYNSMDSAGTIQPEALPFSSRFRVAPARPLAEKPSFVKGLKITGEVAAGIVLFPVMLLFWLISCPINGQCSDC